MDCLRTKAAGAAVVLATAAWGCATRSGAVRQDDLPARKDPFLAAADRVAPALHAQFRREVADLPLLPLSLGKGAWTGVVAASSAPSVSATAEGYELEVPLADAPVQCSLVTGGLDAAQTVAETVAQVGKSGLKVLFVVPSVEATRGGPLLAADILYAVEGQGAVGEFKSAVLSSPGASLHCRQDGAGYRESFLRVVRSLGESLRAPAAEPVRGRELLTSSMGDGGVGFSDSSSVALKDGAVLHRTRSSMLGQAGPAILVGLDRYTYQRTRGPTIELSGFVYGRAGELVGNVVLTREGGGYAAKGEWKGQRVDAAFAHPGLSACAPDDDARMPALLAGTIQELRYERWHPDMRLDGTFEERVGLAPGAPRSLLFQAGALKSLIELDGEGKARRMTVPVGELRLVSEVAWRTGVTSVDGCGATAGPAR